MCGIVGVAVNGPAILQMKEFFCDLLYHDIVRGRHATGVAAIDTMKQLLTVEKRAVPADVFLTDKEIMENLFATKHDFNIYIGHNRFATQGAKDDDANAHPFVHGDLVGVHNGTLRNQKLLDDHKDFVVDSDNLYYHLNKNGIDDTVTKLDGAFSLVWYNRENSTLNFLRNDERPMAIGKLTNGAWVWASEMGMLRWLVSRHKSLQWATETEDKVTTQMVYNLEPGLMFTIPYKKGNRQMDLVRIAKKTLPKFERQSYTSQYGGYGGNSWDYDSNRNSSTRSERAAARNAHSSTPHRSEHQKKGDAVVAKFLTGGSQLSSVQVEFMGHAKPVSPAGFEQSISLFKYRNIRGLEVTLYAYNHAANICSTWGEADIGRKVFGDISNASAWGPGSLEPAKNPQLDDWTISIWNLTEKASGAYFGFTEIDKVRPLAASDADIQARIDKMEQEKKEGGSGTVVPFRQAQQAPATKSQERSGSESVTEAIVKGKQVPGEKVMLVVANELVSLWRLEEYLKENHYACANCGGQLGRVQLSNLHIHEWFDRETGKTSNYLSCRRACHNDMELFTNEIDADYEKLLGTQGND